MAKFDSLSTATKNIRLVKESGLLTKLKLQISRPWIGVSQVPPLESAILQTVRDGTKQVDDVRDIPPLISYATIPGLSPTLIRGGHKL